MSDNPKYLRISAELTDDAFVKAVYLASALEIETLKRERDEARDLYQRMRQAVAGDGTYGDASQLLSKWGFGNHPEWRKDGA